MTELGHGSGRELTLVSTVAGFNNRPAVHFDNGLGLDPLKLNTSTKPRTVFIVNITGGSVVVQQNRLAPVRSNAHAKETRV